MQSINTGNPQLDAYGVVGSNKRLRKNDLKVCWDLILSAISTEGNWTGLGIAYGKASGFVAALYYADVIDQANATVLKQVRDEVHIKAGARLTEAKIERA
jgi:hypothetical protein